MSGVVLIICGAVLMALSLFLAAVAGYGAAEAALDRDVAEANETAGLFPAASAIVLAAIATVLMVMA